MYVVKFILNFTYRLGDWTTNSLRGENELYYKYMLILEKLNTYYYIIIMEDVITLIVCLIGLILSWSIISHFDDH